MCTRLSANDCARVAESGLKPSFESPHLDFPHGGLNLAVMNLKHFHEILSSTRLCILYTGGNHMTGSISAATLVAWFARIGNSSDSCESAWRAKKRGFNCEWFARIDSRESRCESPLPLISKQGSTPYPLGAGSARPNPKMGAPDPGNPLFLGFSVLRGGLRPWSQTMVSEGGRPWGRGRSGDCELRPPHSHQGCWEAWSSIATGLLAPSLIALDLFWLWSNLLCKQMTSQVGNPAVLCNSHLVSKAEVPSVLPGFLMTLVRRFPQRMADAASAQNWRT